MEKVDRFPCWEKLDLPLGAGKGQGWEWGWGRAGAGWGQGQVKHCRVLVCLSYVLFC